MTKSRQRLHGARGSCVGAESAPSEVYSRADLKREACAPHGLDASFREKRTEKRTTPATESHPHPGVHPEQRRASRQRRLLRAGRTGLGKQLCSPRSFPPAASLRSTPAAEKAPRRGNTEHCLTEKRKSYNDCSESNRNWPFES